jgi:hypothetical protein
MHCLRGFLGIWECLQSQHVVDFIRLQVSQGTPFFDIPGLIFDHCLFPKREEQAVYINGEPEYAGLIGQDNMTMIVVALLHGRTKEGWYEWIRNRVNSGHGYKTPSGPPQLYPKSATEPFVKRMKELEEKQAKEIEKQAKEIEEKQAKEIEERQSTEIEEKQAKEIEEKQAKEIVEKQSTEIEEKQVREREAC